MGRRSLGESPANARIFSRERARSPRVDEGAGERPAGHHGHVALAVGAADDRHRALAGEHRLGGARHGLEARRAGAAHAERLDVLGHPGAEDDLARDVRRVEARDDLPVDDELDLGRIELGPRQELADDEAARDRARSCSRYDASRAGRTASAGRGRSRCARASGRPFACAVVPLPLAAGAAPALDVGAAETLLVLRGHPICPLRLVDAFVLVSARPADRGVLDSCPPNDAGCQPAPSAGFVEAVLSRGLRKGPRARCRISPKPSSPKSKKSAVEDDCVALIDAEVADKGGLTGLAIKAGYKTVQGIKPGFVRQVVTDLLPEFARALDPLYQEAKSAGHGVRDHFNAERRRASPTRSSASPTRRRGAPRAAWSRARTTSCAAARRRTSRPRSRASAR